jgi:hypothetical protein
MNNKFKRYINFIIVLILFLLGIIITYFSPSEVILESLAKVVYLHGALIWVGLILFLIIGITSSLNLFLNKSYEKYLISLQEVVTIFWISSTVLGFVVAYLSWGGILWVEPRLLSSIMVSIISIIIYYINSEAKKESLKNILYILQLLVVYTLIIISSRIFHPENSILESDLNIQISFISLIIIFLFLALQISRIRKLNRN